MTQEEFNRILEQNKKEVKLAMEEFEKHSEEFNRKIKNLISAL